MRVERRLAIAVVEAQPVGGRDHEARVVDERAAVTSPSRSRASPVARHDARVMRPSTTSARWPSGAGATRARCQASAPSGVRVPLRRDRSTRPASSVRRDHVIAGDERGARRASATGRGSIASRFHTSTRLCAAATIHGHAATSRRGQRAGGARERVIAVVGERDERALRLGRDHRAAARPRSAERVAAGERRAVRFRAHDRRRSARR